MKKKQLLDCTSIDLDYVSVIRAAARLHNPCAPIERRIGDVLNAIGAMEIRRPNDWQFEYTGFVTLRWHDGGEKIGGSKKWISFCIHGDHASIRGAIDSELRYDSGGVTINKMSFEDAIQVLKVLVGMVDKTSDTSK